MKKLLAMALSSAMILGTLAGCSSSDSGSTGGTTTGTTTGDTTTTTTTDGGTIKVGILANTTGGAAQYGVSVSNGANFYINQVNESGGINGKQIEVVEYDDKGESAEVISLFNRLEGDGISGVIGCVLSGTSIALADETYAANMPQISASATAYGLTVMEDTGEVRTNVFRACFIDPFQGEKMANYASEKLSATTAAVIFCSGDDYSVGLKDAFVAECEALGITVVAEEAYSVGDVSFQAQMTTIAGQNPDVVFVPNYYEDVGLIVTQGREVGVTGTFIGGDGWAGVSGYASAEDLEGSVYCSGFSGDVEFETAFAAAYNVTPGMFEALGYDAALLMINAIEIAEAGSNEAGSAEYKQDVISALAGTSGVEGLTGTFAFDEFNNPIKTASMIEITSGAEVFTEQY
ncbi:MAG: ABC transporter substrate-binding protein [Eubacteriales bacterium]